LGIKIPAPGKIATANKVALKIWMWLAHRQNAGARLGISVECVNIRCLLPRRMNGISGDTGRQQNLTRTNLRHIKPGVEQIVHFLPKLICISIGRAGQFYADTILVKA
jgi:hypothetical protein